MLQHYATIKKGNPCKFATVHLQTWWSVDQSPVSLNAAVISIVAVFRSLNAATLCMSRAVESSSGEDARRHV